MAKPNNINLIEIVAGAAKRNSLQLFNILREWEALTTWEHKISKKYKESIYLQ